MYIYDVMHLFSRVLAGSWYESDVNKEVAEDLKDGTTPPHSDSYTINGQPGDFLPCSNGKWTHTN